MLRSYLCCLLFFTVTHEIQHRHDDDIVNVMTKGMVL